MDANDLPEAVRARGQRTYRLVEVDGKEVEFSEGFGDLHSRLYEEVLAGRGFGLEENRVAIETVAHIRSAKAAPLSGDSHPLLAKKAP